MICSDSKNVGYVATPHPSKQTGKPTLLITSSRLRSQEITAATLTTGDWRCLFILICLLLFLIFLFLSNQAHQFTHNFYIGLHVI